MMKYKKEKNYQQAASMNREKDLDDSIVQRCLFVTSLLSQFKIPYIRQDFSNGQFVYSSRVRITLDELDSLHTHLLPPWDSGESIHGRLKQAQHHLCELVSGSSKLFEIGMKFTPRSFSAWNKVLYELAADDYWEDCKLLSPALSVSQSDKTSVSKPILSEKAMTNAVQVESHNIKDQVEVKEGGVKGDAVGVKPRFQNCVQLPSSGISSKILCLNDSVRRSEAIKFAANPPSPKSAVLDAQSSTCGAVTGNETEPSHGKNQERIFPVNCSSSDFVLRCSTCGGNHLGMNCWKFHQVPSCFWCGKRGHVEENCWRKSGACLICGSAAHKIKQCPRFIPMRSELFPPWCSRCGCTHMGNDCHTPYME